MCKQFSGVIFLILSLFGCAHMHHPISKVEIALAENHHLESFTSVMVSGNLDVTLHTGSHAPSVVVQGSQSSLQNTLWTVRNGVLYVSLGKGYPKEGRVLVDISTNQLRSFSYHGVGTVIGKNLRSPALDLSINNPGKTLLEGHLALHKVSLIGKGTVQVNGLQSRSIQLTLAGHVHAQFAGVANVVSLHMKGQSWLSLYWVKSQVVTIRAKDNAFVQLAGITPILNVELRGNARFNGRYLRATCAFVKTYDNSEADISVLKSQHTLASGASNIYFYDLPDFKTDFMAVNGAVLDMREWEIVDREEPNRYNH